MARRLSKHMMCTIPMAALTLLGSAKAQSSYPMTKLGEWACEADLAYYYAEHARPLIIINNIVYLPHARCIDVRHFGGSYTMKDQDGNITLKMEGGYSEEKEMSGEQDYRNDSGDVDDRSASGGNAGKTIDADDADKSQSGVVEQRLHEEEVATRMEDGDVEAKTAGGDGDSRSSDTAASEKLLAGGQEDRNSRAGNETKSYGGITLFIRCRAESGELDLINYLSRQPVQLYDINGLAEVQAVNIRYEE